LESFVFVVWLIDFAYVFDNVFSKLGPLQMTISIDVYGLKKLNQIANKVILAYFVFGSVEFFHEIDEGG
jgi:hypothetical protein